jgi:hypothetical protein
MSRQVVIANHSEPDSRNMADEEVIDAEPVPSTIGSNNPKWKETPVNGIQTIKCSLQRIVRDDRIRNRIIEDVLEMSIMAVEFSELAYYSLYKMLENEVEIPREIIFLNYMYQLMGTRPIEPGFQVLRQEAGIAKVYDTAYRGNLYNTLSKEYETNLRNNIWMNAEKRVRHFLKNLNPGVDPKIIQQHIDFMFEYNFYEKDANESFRPNMSFLPAELDIWFFEPGHFDQSAHLSTCLPFLTEFYKIQ